MPSTSFFAEFELVPQTFVEDLLYVGLMLTALNKIIRTKCGGAGP
jgi:hypothetical protein